MQEKIMRLKGQPEEIKVITDKEIIQDSDDSIRPLELEFIGRGEVKGFEFRQILCGDYAYLYEVQDEGKIYFEVFQKRINRRYSSISYPTANAFGIWAWTYKDIDPALDKFHSINYSTNLKNN